MAAPGCLAALMLTPLSVALARTYVSNQLSGGNSTSYTATAQAIGSGPWVIVGVVTTIGTTATVTLGGASMTLIGRDLTTGGAFFYIAHPGGSTADIVVSVDSTSNFCNLGVWNLDRAPDSWTPYDTASVVSGTTTTVNVAEGGVGFAVSWDNGAGGDTWSAGLTLDYTGQLGSDGASGAGASADFSASETGMTLTFSGDNMYCISLR